jgi:hypothetical protein
MRLGIEAAFRVANASGGVQGRQLRLIAADDGYEPVMDRYGSSEKDQLCGRQRRALRRQSDCPPLIEDAVFGHSR